MEFDNYRQEQSKSRTGFWFIILRKRTLAAAAALVAAVAVLAAAVWQTGAAAVYLGFSSRKLPVYSVETTQKQVALSFDIWDENDAKQLLAAVEGSGAGATFFVTGMFAKAYPDTVRQMCDAGMEVGSLSNTRPHMTRLKPAQIEIELLTASQSIEAATGEKTRLFRAPYGEYNDRLLTACEGLGLTAVQWDTDSGGEGATSLQMTEEIVPRVKSGSVILIRGGSQEAYGALPAILAGLFNRGYSVTSVGDILPQGDCYVDAAGVMRVKA